MGRFAAVVVFAWSFSAFAADDVGLHGATIQPFVGFGIGVGGVVSHHPLLTAFFVAPEFSLNAGIEFRKMWIFSAEVTSVSKFVTRTGDDSGTFKTATGVACTSCADTAGGQLVSGNATFPAIGPRIDFSPMGETSPYLSVSGGFAATQGAIGYDIGAYITGRLGFRYRFVKHVEAALEGGYQAAWLGKTAALHNAFGTLMLRAYF